MPPKKDDVNPPVNWSRFQEIAESENGAYHFADQGGMSPDEYHKLTRADTKEEYHEIWEEIEEERRERELEQERREREDRQP